MYPITTFRLRQTGQSNRRQRPRIGAKRDQRRFDCPDLQIPIRLAVGVNSHQSMNRGFSQKDIDSAIDEAASRHNVDPSLVRSVVKVESNFNPNAVSSKGAMGLMQLMPSTARSLNVSNPFDPAQNVDAGVRHLRKLLDNYGGNVQLSLAAYNAGAGAVARSAGVPHFRETQNYVRRITSLYNGGVPGTSLMGNSSLATSMERASREPVRVQRDAQGVLTMSNTD